MPTKNALRGEKFKAVRSELASLKTGDPDAHPYHGGHYHYELHPVPIDDPHVTSRLYGPQMRSTQWTPTTK